MTNNLHHPRAVINACFFSLGLGYHQIQIVGLEFLQCCGHQIRVNTWTGSYSSKPTRGFDAGPVYKPVYSNIGYFLRKMLEILFC